MKKLRKSEWIHTAADERAWSEGCRPDEAAADMVRRFFRQLRHSKGEYAGQPFELLDWQWDDVIKPLFAWKRPDGTRRYRIGYIEVPKKNGKSTLMSGIALYLLCADGEDGAEVYSAAADREQASIIYREAANMVQSSPGLARRMRVIDTTKRIVYQQRKAFYKALSAESTTKEGLNIHGLLFDELHAQKNRDLWDSLRYGGASRRQPLHLSITTAGYDRESICYQQHDYARKIIEGVVDDPTYFAYIKAAPIDADWTDPEVWKAANPSWGKTIKEETFAADCAEAQESPTQENAFRRYRLNQWVQQEERLIPMIRWDACDDELDPAGLEGRACYAGLDLASTQDIAALSLVFPDGDGGYAVLPYFWVPAENAHLRERRDRVPYLTWARQGYVEMTPGNVIDYDRIRKCINELSERFYLRELACDRWNATQLLVQLEGDGLQVVAFGQGYKDMTTPTKKLIDLVVEKKLVHGGNPVLRWMADNVAGETDAADNWKPSKKKSTEKIDGIVATIMAIGIAEATESAESEYETPGSLAI